MGGVVSGVVGAIMPALRVLGSSRRGLSLGLGGCCKVVFEAFGVDEAADGVVREVAESQGDAAQVLEAPVDGFGGAVGGVGVVEVGQDILACFSEVRGVSRTGGVFLPVSR